jgi:hypothetical protein
MIRPFARCWNSQCKWTSSSKRGMRNPPTIDRRNFRIDRSGCRIRSVEASDNRQMISGNRQIDSPVDRPNGSPNRKVIVNRIAVIVNSAALDLSTIHQQNGRL